MIASDLSTYTLTVTVDDSTSMPTGLQHVTPNQIVAYNMARYRKAAGITQDELADRLTGWTPKKWSKAAVSLAERSWDGKKIRQFDADLIFGLALALNVPVTAFFLPPESDRRGEYVVRSAYRPQRDHSIHEYTAQALREPTDPDNPVTAEYVKGLASAAGDRGGSSHLSSSYQVRRYQAAEEFHRLSTHREALRELTRDIDAAIASLRDQIEQNPSSTQDIGNR